MKQALDELCAQMQADSVTCSIVAGPTGAKEGYIISAVRNGRHVVHFVDPLLEGDHPDAYWEEMVRGLRLQLST